MYLYFVSLGCIYVWKLEESGANAVFPVQAGGASQAGASDDGVDRAHTREGGGMAHLSRLTNLQLVHRRDGAVIMQLKLYPPNLTDQCACVNMNCG